MRADRPVRQAERSPATDGEPCLITQRPRAQGRAVTFADGQALQVSAVIWATGYRSDYSWIHLPVLGPDSLPRHQRGVTRSPGLYFLGMHNQYSRGSSLIHWVRHDAAYITGQARARAEAPGVSTGPGDDDDQEGTAGAPEQVPGQLAAASGIPETGTDGGCSALGARA